MGPAEQLLSMASMMGPLASGSKVVGERGKYVVGSKRVEGGMGYIHWGHEDGRPSQRVVLKTAREGTDHDDVISKKLVDEADILRTVNHRNIVKYVDRRLGGQFVLILECLDGQSFHAAFKEKPASEHETRIYADTILETLQYLHSRNIIYRDLKPQNVLTDARRRLVMLDFGAAKLGYLHAYGPGTIVATQGWSAPEQFTTGEVTEASDIYALGMILFFLLTGKEPSRFMLHDGSLMKGPRDLNPSVSRELSEVVLRATRPDPRLRPQTADDMRKLLIGTYAPLGVPNIVVAGRTYQVRAEMEIGKAHSCDQARCPVKRQLDISVNDPGNYVSRHHARISVDKFGRCWLEDIGSVNDIAVSRRGLGWYRLPKRSRYELKDKDIVALVYADTKGPYMTFTFNAS